MEFVETLRKLLTKNHSTITYALKNFIQVVKSLNCWQQPRDLISNYSLPNRKDITHLNEEELKLMEESDNRSAIEAQFRINRISFGIFESDYDKFMKMTTMKLNS